jgi:two-component system, LuxR family, response regulator FixJ
MREANLIYIVDEDQIIRESTSLMLEGQGYRCAVYASVAEFLAANPKSSDGCLLLDTRMRGLDGLALQIELAKRGLTLPVIFMTEFSDIVHAVRSLKTGAVAAAETSCPPHAFVDAIDRALGRGRTDRMITNEALAAQRRVSRLSPREREVLKGLVAGQPHKVVARKLGISTRTVEIHRARIIEKVEARSFSELVRIAMAASSEQSV